MPSEKPHRIRIIALDGKPREPNKLRGQLAPHVDVIDVKNKVEFVICALKEAHLDQIRPKLASAGLEEVPGGETNVTPSPPKPNRVHGNQRRSQGQRSDGGQRGSLGRRSEISEKATRSSSNPPLKRKPYGFVPLPDSMSTKPPIWHDGTCAQGRLSGEIRFEITTLTPLLVGWERRRIDDSEESWAVPYTCTGGDEDKVQVTDAGQTIKSKSVLCPLRAPWGERPVLLPGDSIKGLLRHEIGALLGAPMERVAERSYSYRPNSLYPKDPNPRLVARLARILEDGIAQKWLDSSDGKPLQVRVPVKLGLLPTNLKFDRHHTSNPPRYRFDAIGGATYRGGQGAGERLNSSRKLHRTLEVNPDTRTLVDVPESVQIGYINTVRHLTELAHGHFSERHPDVPTKMSGVTARDRIRKAAAEVVFQPGDLIWVEWDAEKECIVSLGWHYYYRWAYVDTVRKQGWKLERQGLFPLEAEKAQDANKAPQGLSAVRRLFGYTGDNEGSQGVGLGDHSQLMGRLSVNSAIELIPECDTPKLRFLPPTFLKELGRPRPSAVEHYLQQPDHPQQRPSDRASLATYGDAPGYDEPGKLAGRKFYLDRTDAYTSEPWKDDSEVNRLIDRSTLALEASCPGRRFRFTVRFRDLEPFELAAVLVVLCPHQFRELLNGTHADGYCSKLGYARPLGWGSVRIEAKALLLLESTGEKPVLHEVANLPEWVHGNFTPTPMLAQWLAIHRCKHPEAADYPRGLDENVYTYHTKLRADHSRARRYDRENHL